MTPAAERSTPVDVVVALPAKDEEATLPACLAHVLAAASYAQGTGVVGRVVVAVGAHRCSDGTHLLADAMLADHARVDGLVHEDAASRSVGEVRAGLVARAAALLPGPSEVWLFNTDADSSVPVDWLTRTLDEARATDAVAVAGLVEVRGWVAGDAARQRYQEILDEGISGAGHAHVYGANLAVRLDAYRAVGGFRHVPHGEDHDLVDRLRAAGHTVATPFAPLVLTSGRTPGRAHLGLGGLLARLAEVAPVDAVDRSLPEPA